jgi:uncharacterized protein YkwD
MKLFFIALFPFLLLSFNFDAHQKEDKLYERCNTAKDIGYLSKEEKSVILYLNLVRINPPLFAQTYLKNYLDTAPIKQTEYLESLLNELKNMQPVEVVKPQYDLFEVAKKHATEMGLQGKTGHSSLNGEGFESRASDLSKRYQKALENCQYGYSDGLGIVIDLLIDENIPDLSHRKSLLDKNIKYIGVAIRKHKVYRHNCVIELGYELKY